MAKDHVHIQISYHGGLWRYHTVSAEFWSRLQAFLDKRRRQFDCVAEISPYRCDGCPR